MAFLGIYKAVYDYEPQSEGELAIAEGDILYLLEKDGEDDWWKAKKKANADDEDEPVGLIPNNYVEEAPVISQARALYDYTRQTDEEISFSEDAKLQIYDNSDPDWILVGTDGEFGFAPANYIDMTASTEQQAEPEQDFEPASEPAAPPLPPSLPVRPSLPDDLDEPQSPPLPTRQPSSAAETSSVIAAPAATLAGVMQGRSSTRAATPPPITVPPRRQYLSEESEDEPSPALPIRPRTQSATSNDPPIASPPPQRTSSRRQRNYDDEVPEGSHGRIAPGGFHMYNINEMVSVMGKKKKMPTTLGVNMKTGLILIAPERATDGPTQEWSADRMTHYSREGKHVFLELVRPSRSIDFHAGAKDTAAEIVSALGELSGAIRAEGLREVIMAGTGQNSQRKGVILYDFMAQGDDEVTVAIGDEVIVIDDAKSEEWWQVRRLKNNTEGVVPSSYIEITGTVTPSTSSSTSGLNAGRSTVKQNRMEEERLTREAIKRDQKAAEVGPGMRLPDRKSSLFAVDNGNQSGQQRNNRENGRTEASSSNSKSSAKSKPDPSKVRIWTDRSKSFSVEAQLLGVKDGKINLHKVNGVKIAVPVAKMSAKDLEYVELITGISLDEDRPLSDVKRAQSMRSQTSKQVAPKVGVSIDQQKPEYDWFQFFLSCDVAVGLCERYAQSFTKDSMDETVLPDVDASVLRNLGLREGDIIKVMRYLDKKYNRDSKKRGVSFAGDDDGEGAQGGLFSGPGGTLRNNTRKGRPAPAVETNNTVDPKAFSVSTETSASSPTNKSPITTRSKADEKATAGGFDDDAWNVKPTSKQPEPQAKPAAVSAATPIDYKPAAQEPPPTAAMLDLSLLSKPLEPEKIQPTAPPQSQVVQPAPQAVPQQQQPTATGSQEGASPAFFTGLAQQHTGLASMPTGQPLGLGLGGSRQRPQAPQMTQGQAGLVPPPPLRPLSAPQSALPSGFAPPPLQPQMTGIAPPGQTLNDMNQQRLQQQQQQQQQQQLFMGGFQPQQTGQGMVGFNTGPGVHQSMMPQPTGFSPSQFLQPTMTGVPQMQQGPFGDPRSQQFSPIQNQPTGFPGAFPAGQQQIPQPTGSVNQFLPPAMEPQRTGLGQMQTGMQPHQTGFGGSFSQSFNPNLNGQANQAAPMAPLQPQQTGPAPPVRFGVPEKIQPQATGRRANLAQATPQNPFGF